jgi:hypothetical protein
MTRHAVARHNEPFMDRCAAYRMTVSGEMSPDEEQLKFKSQQWILHAEGESFCRRHFDWKGPHVELSLGGQLNSYFILTQAWNKS